MKFRLLGVGVEGFGSPNNSKDKTNQATVAVKIPVLLRHSAVPCSIFIGEAKGSIEVFEPLPSLQKWGITVLLRTQHPGLRTFFY
jgi:hypothetical protein